MDRIADAFGFDKLEFRKKNMLVDGDIDVCGQETYNNTAIPALEKAAEYIEWGKDMVREEGPWIIGKGIAVANKYTESGTTSIVTIKLLCDGVVEVHHFHVEIGQGCNTIHQMIAAEEFGIDPSLVKIVFDDSETCLFDYGTFCSRGTFMNGTATILACSALKKNICNYASALMQVPAENLTVYGGKVFETNNPEHSLRMRDLFDYFGYVPEIGELTGIGYYYFPQGIVDDETGQGNPVAFYSHGALGVEAAINRETGEIKLLRCGTWFDMGTQLNRKMCDAQSEGALMMGIGQVCFESELFNESGRVINANFRDYKIPTMLDVPFNSYIALGNTGIPHKDGPYGAKGAGEVVLAPVLPAVANAINNALGIKFNDIPISREALLSAIKEKEREAAFVNNT
jgi:carbon-monoxide dehydrogenase large subunit